MPVRVVKVHPPARAGIDLPPNPALILHSELAHLLREFVQMGEFPLLPPFSQDMESAFCLVEIQSPTPTNAPMCLPRDDQTAFSAAQRSGVAISSMLPGADGAKPF